MKDPLGMDGIGLIRVSSCFRTVVLMPIWCGVSGANVKVRLTVILGQAGSTQCIQFPIDIERYFIWSLRLASCPRHLSGGQEFCKHIGRWASQENGHSWSP